jgi:amino acid transporter
MKTAHILALLVAVTAVAGVVDAHDMALHVQSNGWAVLSTLIFSYLSFYWYRLDSEARLYRRSRWLSVGVVMLAIVAVPYYLVRSRPAGQKRRALLRLAGFCVLLGAAGALGGLAYEWLAPAAT